jgi:hypothetical protein
LILELSGRDNYKFIKEEERRNIKGRTTEAAYLQEGLE